MRESDTALHECVAHRVGPDETVLEHECVDAVVDLGLGGIGSPFEKQNVIFIKLRFKVPFGLGYVALPR
jgi:hypothetical protein